MKGSKSVAVFGTSSGAGKSLVSSLLIKHFKESGYSVAPFKALNVSLNSFAGKDGEVAYAQAFQARVAGIEPEADMNPVLVKPEAGRLHVVLRGRAIGSVTVEEFYSERFQEVLRKAIEESFRRLSSEHELIVIEGTGSPTEINLPDLSNRYVLEMSGARYVLVSDMHLGGSIASSLGTVEILGKEKLIGVVFNRYSGSPELIRPLFDLMLERFGIKVLGYLPLYDLASPWEDSADQVRAKYGRIKVLFVRSPYMSNFTDAFPLYFYPDVGISFQGFVSRGFDLIVFPGSKVTYEDLKYLRSVNAAEEAREAAEEGSLIMGICGGLQALGEKVIDSVESKKGEFEGLGLLKAKTVMQGEKIVSRTEAEVLRGPASGELIRGYEIHYGLTEHKQPFELITKRNGLRANELSGAYEGSVFGTYVHGIFDNPGFSLKLINYLRKKRGLGEISERDLESFDELFQSIYADFEKNVDLSYVDEALGLK
mgnify:FL=1